MPTKYTIHLTVHDEITLKRATTHQYRKIAPNPKLRKAMLSDWRSIRKEHRDPVEADLINLLSRFGTEVRKINRRT